MNISTPEILWHGGGMVSGKNDPVFSIDMHPLNILATAGIDSSIPARGSVHLWKVDSTAEGQDFILDMCDHQSCVHVVRFSPCGKMLASASDRLIVIYTVESIDCWGKATDMSTIKREWIHPNLTEIYDLEWSPDSACLIVGAIDSKGEIFRLGTRDTIMLTGHANYVQGVAWDPYNEVVLTQSADRSIKMFPIKYKPGSSVKLQNKGQMVAKMISANTSTIVENANGQPATHNTGLHLYASSTEGCFFRRPSFSPDGALLISPTGIHRSVTPFSTQPGTSWPVTIAAPSQSNSTPLVAHTQSYCTHVYSRQSMFPSKESTHTQCTTSSVPPGASSDKGVSTPLASTGLTPIYSLAGLEEPSVAVRCSPILYELIPNHPPLLSGKYRMLFAVVTFSAVFVYDTQHTFPLVKVSGMHYATLNDVSWSADGQMIVLCSSDGYVSFIRFPAGALGTPLTSEKVPLAVKRSHPVIYKYSPPADETNGQSFSAAQPVSIGTEGATAVSHTLALPVPVADFPVTDASGVTDSSDKKKRRITPMLVGDLGNAAAPLESSSEVIPTIVPVATSAAQIVPGGSKKRITPTLISQTPAVVISPLIAVGVADAAAVSITSADQQS